MISVGLPESFDAWRSEARKLLAAEIAPQTVVWANDGLFPGSALPEPKAPARVPRSFVALAEVLACHRDTAKWALLYRLLWRLLHNEPYLLDVEADDDVAQAALMAKAIYRDEHKMKAFVRFRQLADGYVAWHRPDHFVLPRVVPFFVERFYAMKWSILTPDASAIWQDEQLTFGPGAPREQAPSSDEMEEVWRDYYASIFNPARVNLRLMQQHIPKKHWATLPELTALPQMLANAQPRVEKMLTRVTPSKVAAVPNTQSYETLAAAAKLCQACPLHARATQTVFGEGPLDARVMFVGEQPGDQEDHVGRPFVGPAGALFDKALQQAGISRHAVYVTNAVKHFKWLERGKRRLHQRASVSEMKTCTPWLEAELQMVKPQVIVCLGATAAHAILGHHVQVTALRGQRVHTSRAPACIVTYHPSAILRMNGDERDAAYADFVNDLRGIDHSDTRSAILRAR